MGTGAKSKNHRPLSISCIMLACIGVTLLPSRRAQSTIQMAPAYAPQFSTRATRLDRDGIAVSPDGKISVQIRPLPDSDSSQPALVIVRSGNLKLDTNIPSGFDAEILWSPDSQAFALTGSSEGANGLYQMEVIRISERGMHVVQLTPMIREAFGHPVKCGWQESPNVAAIRWAAPSQELIVAAEIIHHSNCDSFGTFEAYAVSLDGPKIERTYDQLEARRLFGDELGPELRQADDGCIRNPPSCYVRENHPELKRAP